MIQHCNTTKQSQGPTSIMTETMNKKITTTTRMNKLPMDLTLPNHLIKLTVPQANHRSSRPRKRWLHELAPLLLKYSSAITISLIVISFAITAHSEQSSQKNRNDHNQYQAEYRSQGQTAGDQKQQQEHLIDRRSASFSGRHHQPFASLQPSSSMSTSASTSLVDSGDDSTPENSDEMGAGGNSDEGSRDYSGSDSNLNSTTTDYESDAGDESNLPTGNSNQDAQPVADNSGRGFLPVVGGPSRPLRELVSTMNPMALAPSGTILSSTMRLAPVREPATTTPSPRNPIQSSPSPRGQRVQLEDRRAPPSQTLDQQSGLNLNMGTTRLFIKQPISRESSPTTTMGYDREELATESVKRELNSINERRQDLLYPSSSQLEPSEQAPVAIDGRQQHQQQQADLISTSTTSQHQLQQQQQSICYTPIALLMVILITMLVTVIVCFCTHVLIKHLSRRQFDLIENSKQFGIKHGSSSYGSQQQLGAAPATVSTVCGSSNSGGLLEAGGDHHHHQHHHHQQQQQQDQLNSVGENRAKRSYMLNLFQNGGSSSKASSSSTTTTTGKRSSYQRDQLSSSGAGGGGCAFDNPYFDNKDDFLARQQMKQEQHQQLAHHHPHQHHNHHRQGLLTTSCQLSASGSNRQQLDFIENHISNLHNKQVTSSVKELSIFGGNNKHLQQLKPVDQARHQPVVDLTSDELRARIIANPQQGDLVAVDITGSDFMGLGFEVCGDASEGIFIKSVLSRGPARESGCIHPGDRIKCLNISFEGITLQDAYDILNCASPYRMRLLLEKQALPMSSKRFENLRSTLVLRQASSSNQNNPSVTKAKNYIKRLTNFVATGSGQANRGAAGSDYNAALANAKRLQAEESSQVYLGSALARKHLEQPMMLMGSSSHHETAHVNIAYQEDLPDEDDDQHDDDDSHRVNVVENYDCQDGRAMRIISCIQSTANEFHSQTADSSLDYENANANHKLHGPRKLDKAASEEPLNIGTNLAAIKASDDSANNIINSSIDNSKRRQSDDTIFTGNRSKQSSSSARRSMNLVDQHLSQTQSQPEIARNRIDTFAKQRDRQLKEEEE